MIGKAFLLLFAASVCLGQQEANLMDTAIRKGLLKATYINRNGEKRLDSLVREISFKQKSIQTKTSDNIMRSLRMQVGVAQALANVADLIKEKARETNKPESVFECINKIEEDGNRDVDGLVQTLIANMKQLEKDKLENVRTYSKVLAGKPEALRARNDRAVKEIKECKTPEAVDIAVNSFRMWVDMLYAEMSRVRNQVNIAVTNFNRDANSYSNITNRQVNKIKLTASRNIRQCIFNKEVFYEQFMLA